MRYLYEFGQNQILWTAVLSWFIAQVLKVVLVYIEKRKIDIRRMIGSGGMPSSHSSFSVALAASVGFVDGFSSPGFAICFCFALVVMYDAAGVRRSAGQQAKILNKIIEEWEEGNFENTERKLKELLGHTPIEVVAGAVLGIIVSIIRFA
ncbi:MAG: divergent PAP2 family protein [Clostridia bacterium]|nr:divergent PAP2 family protein [Clostridia bacterium]